MDILRLILLVLLGFLTPAMTTVSSQMTGVVMRDMGQDLNDAALSDTHTALSDTSPNDRARGGLSHLLLAYTLKCGLDPDTPPAPISRGVPPAPGSKGWRLRDRYCRSWFQCKSNGKKFQTKNVIVSMANSR